MRAAVAIIVLGWIPYVLLRLFWEYLLLTVPGASHGEVSGPILYFLPRLLAFAAFLTGIVAVFISVVVVLRKRDPIQPPNGSPPG